MTDRLVYIIGLIIALGFFSLVYWMLGALLR
jgi:hypothetical protein